jgi:hypothetical protein
MFLLRNQEYVFVTLVCKFLAYSCALHNLELCQCLTKTVATICGHYLTGQTQVAHSFSVTGLSCVTGEADGGNAHAIKFISSPYMI